MALLAGRYLIRSANWTGHTSWLWLVNGLWMAREWSREWLSQTAISLASERISLWCMHYRYYHLLLCVYMERKCPKTHSILICYDSRHVQYYSVRVGAAYPSLPLWPCPPVLFSSNYSFILNVCWFPLCIFTKQLPNNKLEAPMLKLNYSLENGSVL